MKSEHRHELGTNVLATRLETYVERFRPYLGKVFGGIIAIIAAVFIWSYLSSSSAARHSEAWDTYNQAVGSMPMNLDKLRHASEEFPGTSMQRAADVTWADGQVWAAARDYIYNREAAKEALNRAAGAYQGVISSSNDERLVGRARLGLARIYEMQNELDKASDEYKKVTGSYALYAKQEAERVAKPEAKATYAWLALAQPPRPTAPVGPGTPGQKPLFSPGEIALPGETGADAGKTDDSTGGSQDLEKLFKDMPKDAKAKEAPDNRYAPNTPQGTDGKTPAADKDAAPGAVKDGSAPPPDAAPPKGDAKSGPATETPPPADKTKK